MSSSVNKDRAKRESAGDSGSSSSEQPMLEKAQVDETDEQQVTVSETVVDAVTGHDRPIGEKNPAAPLALVWYTYPLILLLVLIVAAIWLAFS